MMTLDERVSSVQSRSATLAKRERIRTTRMIAGACCAVLACMAVLVGIAGAGNTVPGETDILYGASLFDVGAGGYVLVGIVCAVVAVAITLICIKHRDRRDEQSGKALE